MKKLACFLLALSRESAVEVVMIAEGCPRRAILHVRKAHQSLRPGCCGKKRKASQCSYEEGYEGGAWKCKPGYGCQKDKEKISQQ